MASGGGLEIASLSAEYCQGSGFIVTAFEIPVDAFEDMTLDGIPKRLVDREACYDIIKVDFEDYESDKKESNGLLCVRSTDETYIERWGEEKFDKTFRRYGVDTIWGWAKDSGIRPCPVYLRHCYLGAKSRGEECCNSSFLDESFLVDRTTSVREYLDQYPVIMWNSVGAGIPVADDMDDLRCGLLPL